MSWAAVKQAVYGAAPSRLLPAPSAGGSSSAAPASWAGLSSWAALSSSGRWGMAGWRRGVTCSLLPVLPLLSVHSRDSRAPPKSNDTWRTPLGVRPRGVRGVSTA